MYKVPANTLFIGQQLVFVPECHSTNDEVQQLIQQNSARNGVVVITDRQTLGRGQRGSRWESEPGKNLTFSIGLQPHFLEAKDQFCLGMAISLGLFDFLAETLKDADVKIKWPNDILVNYRKICGILIENNLSGKRIQQSVIGVGLNVNQVTFTYPQASSLALVTGRGFSLPQVLEDLLSHLEGRYLQLRSQSIDVLMKNYLDALFRRGEKHVFKSADIQFEGTIEGVDPQGRLVIQVDGRLKYFDQKQVQYN